MLRGLGQALRTLLGAGGPPPAPGLPSVPYSPGNRPARLDPWVAAGTTAGYHHRANVHTGDVLLFRATGPVAAIIRWSGRTSYSHVGLAAWWGERLLVLESRELRGCRAVPLSSAAATGRVDLYRVRGAGELERADVLEEALKHLGGAYGWASILRMAFTRLPVGLLRMVPVLRRVLPKGPSYSENDGDPSGPRMVCSEYVARCWRAAGPLWDLVPRLADRNTEPGDLARSALLEPVGTLTLEP